MFFYPNPILLSDSYKLTHWKQYPPGTNKVYSYLEARGGIYEEIVALPLLRYFLDQVLVRFENISQQDIKNAKRFAERHFGQDYFNHDGWEHLYSEYTSKGRKLPIIIKAVPEGTIVPVGNVLATIENTDPKCFWLPNFLETVFSQQWYTTTVATLDREIKKTIASALNVSGTPESLEFRLHDFGFRGSTSLESAMLAGAAHLVNFQGTDTMPAIEMISWLYQEDEMWGYSVAASEHSTMTSWGRQHEVDAYRNMLESYPDDAIVSVVSDSYDIYNACNKLWGYDLKQNVSQRKGTLVIRPDSGDPIKVVLTILNSLGDKFGMIVNDKGFRTLPPYLRILQGDGVDHSKIEKILNEMMNVGWSADNITFGMGGALHQSCNRDTCKFAFKCCYIEVNGEGREVYKEPVTDSVKNSKRGRLSLVEFVDTFRDGKPSASILRTVPESYRDIMKVYYSPFVKRDKLFRSKFSEIRKRAAI